MPNWIVVASAEHVQQGRLSGFMQVCHGKGQMPFTVVETWKRIWDYFKTENKVQRNFISDFEVYSGPNEVAIYIRIKYTHLINLQSYFAPHSFLSQSFAV